LSSSKSIPLYQVDSFSSEPFRGNPAAVCLLEHAPGKPGGWPLTDEQLLQISAENNLSETAFVVPRHDAEIDSSDLFRHSDAFNLRWFTPTTEVDLCGHATLAAAAVLLKEFGNESSSLRFDTLSGELVASAQPNNMIELDFPTNAPKLLDSVELAVVEPLVSCVRSSSPGFAVENVLYSARTKKLVVVVSQDAGRREYLELLPGLDVAKNLQSVDQTADPAFSELQVRGVIVTMQDSTNEYDFVSRYFAPWVGIDEDPVTGSAHTVIAPMWAEVLGCDTLRARQCSPRGGDLDLTVDWSQGRLQIRGDAFVCIKGALHF
jgi:PhzF family phenazine biosynthesis protein